MADLELPDGFSLTPPDAAPASGLALPDGFAPQPGYVSNVLPFSYDQSGRRTFDPLNAGLLPRLYDAAKSAVTAPSDAYDGRMPTPYSIPRPPLAPGSMNSEASPETLSRATNFASMLSLSNPALRAGEMVPGAISTEAGAPTAQQLKGAASAGYDAARASPLTVPGEDIAGMAQQLQQSLQSDHGVIAKTAPKTFAVLDELATPPEGAFGTYSGLEAARRGLSTIAGEGGTEGFAAQKAIPQLDSFINTISPEAADARANYAAAMRSNNLTGELDRANTGILERAETRAHATHSGTNLDNAIRQRLASLLEKPQEVSGYSDAEMAALRDAVKGGLLQNVARRLGNTLGGQGGLASLAAAAGGAALGGHLMPGIEGPALGAVLPSALGISAKGLENTLGRRSLNSVDELVRQNSPLYRAMQVQGLLTRPAMGRNDAVLRSILPGLIAPQQMPFSLSPQFYGPSA